MRTAHPTTAPATRAVPRRRAGRLERVIATSYDGRRRVLALWFAALIAASVLAGLAGGKTDVDYSVPGTDSSRAIEVLQDHIAAMAGGTVDVVYRADDGATSPAVSREMAELAAALSTVDHVTAVEPGAVSADGKTGVLTVRLDVAGEKLPVASVQQMMAAVEEVDRPGVQVELGGYAVQLAENKTAGSESVGLLAAAVILLIAFGSVLAMGLPILVAVFGLGVALAGGTLLANVFVVPEWASSLVTMIGIGVGIDYALFVVTRYRLALADGGSPREAVIAAGTTAGRAVLFAGGTVVVSLFGLTLMGLDYLWGVAATTSLAVLVMMVASVTLLPAALGFAGRAIDRLRLPWLRNGAATGPTTLAWKWSRVVQRRPWTAALAALAVLVALAAPFMGLRFGEQDAGNGPTSLTSRRAYDLMRDGFGAGANGPLLVAIEAPAGAAAAAAETVGSALRSSPGVAAVFPAVVSSAGDAAVITVVPTTGPQDDATARLVRTLRAELVPAALAGTGAQASIGGATAMFIDSSEFLSGRLPLFIGGVVVLSFLLLMSVFRSVLVALKAAVMNLLSIGAAFGVMAVAADAGWLGRLIGIHEAVPVPVWVPMLMFAILFGLSMDYEVFLLSRIREEYVRTGDNANAVADGLASTARVITAAAAIMVTVFGAFVLEDTVFLKLAGIGLATAVFVDATIVRMVLVPATMELLGDRNWWLPRWLQRVLPTIHVEAEAITTAGGEAPEPVAA